MWLPLQRKWQQRWQELSPAERDIQNTSHAAAIAQLSRERQAIKRRIESGAHFESSVRLVSRLKTMANELVDMVKRGQLKVGKPLCKTSLSGIGLTGEYAELAGKAEQDMQEKYGAILSAVQARQSGQGKGKGKGRGRGKGRGKGKGGKRPISSAVGMLQGYDAYGVPVSKRRAGSSASSSNSSVASSSSSSAKGGSSSGRRAKGSSDGPPIGSVRRRGERADGAGRGSTSSRGEGEDWEDGEERGGKRRRTGTGAVAGGGRRVGPTGRRAKPPKRFDGGGDSDGDDGYGVRRGGQTRRNAGNNG